MKKIFLAVPIMALGLMVMTSCDPSHDNESATPAVSAEQLTNELKITAKSEGNNNLTVFTSPTRYIKVYDATTDMMVGAGTMVQIQIAPPQTEASYYVTTAAMDGTTSIKSGSKSITITEYTDLPEIYNIIFGDGSGSFTAHTWVWDTEASDGVWGNGAYLENSGPGWWVVSAADIDEQAAGKGLPNDGLNGWMTLALTGVKTSRGEVGQVRVTEDKVKEGWDVGRMVFSGTTPLMGIQPNVGGNQYDYHILQATEKNLRLCAPEPGAGDWGTAWFWNFKRDDSAAK
jgi:hypothetical protein